MLPAIDVQCPYCGEPLTLFVDDSQVNVHAARETGLHAVHFRGAAPLREELVRLGLL